MSKYKNKIVIIGLGPAGLAAAYDLLKTDTHVVCIEKKEYVGGLAKTLQFGDFKTDIGPHRFFSKNEDINNFIKFLLKERLIEVNRKTRLYINKKSFIYPLCLKDILQNINFLKFLEFMYSYIYEKIKWVFLKRRPFISFEQKIIFKFGKSLARFNILNYTEKIWGMPPAEISPDWADQRLEGLSLTALIKNILVDSQDCPKSLKSKFYYPELGSGLLYEVIEKEILKSNHCILKTGSFPLKIVHDGNVITKVLIHNGNDVLVYFPGHVISSIPITEFINLLEPKAPEEILRCADNLKFRSHLSLFITLNTASVFRDHWIYFPDKKIPFGRIMEPKNFSTLMSPKDKTSLLVEFFCWENDRIWNLNRRELFELAMPWLERLGFIKREDVVNYYIHKENHAYPVYTIDYKLHLEKIKTYLHRFINLQCIGRCGSFKYNNQDHALEMGRLAAKSIIEGRPCHEEIAKVALENEYFEKSNSNLG